MQKLLAQARALGRKAFVMLMGTAVLLVGVGMIVLPGPSLLVIPLGLGILAREFAWARRWLLQLRSETERLMGLLRRRAA